MDPCGVRSSSSLVVLKVDVLSCEELEQIEDDLLMGGGGGLHTVELWAAAIVVGGEATEAAEAATAGLRKTVPPLEFVDLLRIEPAAMPEKHKIFWLENLDHNFWPR